MATTTRFRVQLITSDGSRWPYVANAYLNRDGSINVYVDPGVTLRGGQKLRVRPAMHRQDEVPSADPAAASSPPGAENPAATAVDDVLAPERIPDNLPPALMFLA